MDFHAMYIEVIYLSKPPIVNDKLIVSKLLKNIIINDDFDSIYDGCSCKICYEPLYKKETLQCKGGHIACKNCFEEHLLFKKECMMCRIEIKSIDELAKVRFIDELLSIQKIKCPFSYTSAVFKQDKEMDNCNFESIYKDSDGCGEVIKIGELESHIKRCYSRFIECPNNINGCEEVIRFKCLYSHLNCCEYQIIYCSFCPIEIQRCQLSSHLEICPSVEVQCHQCSNQFQRGEINKHIQLDCPYTNIQCDYKEYGCTVQFKRSDLEWHFEKINHIKYMTKMIQQQAKQITESNNEIEQLNKALSQKDQKLKQNKTQIKDLNNSISNINISLSKHSELIIESNNQLNEIISLREQLNLLNNSISDIKSNLSQYGCKMNIIWEISYFSERKYHESKKFKFGNVEYYFKYFRGNNTIYFISEKEYENIKFMKLKIRNLINEQKSFKTYFEIIKGEFYKGPYNLEQSFKRNDGFITQDDKLEICIKLYPKNIKKITSELY